MNGTAAIGAAGLDAHVPVSIGATALHYGQSLFEGLKAFACKDTGPCALFPLDGERAPAMARGAALRTLMEAPDEALLRRALARASCG